MEALVSAKKERDAILANLRDMNSGRVRCDISCFRKPDGTPAHPMIARLDELNAILRRVVQ